MIQHASALLGSLLTVLGAAAAPAAALDFTGPPNSPRVYEQVSPVDKNGREVLPYDGQVSLSALATPDGSAVSVRANGAFPGAPNAMQNTFYVSRRTSVWSTSPIEVPQQNLGTDLTRTGAVVAVSRDLSRAVVGSRRALAPGAVEDYANFYLNDLETGELELIFTAPGGSFDGGFPSLWMESARAFAGDASFDRIFFLVDRPLTPDAPSEPGKFIYAYEDGELRLVSTVDSFLGLGARVLQEPSRAVSLDGKRAFLSVGYMSTEIFSPGAGLFMDEGGSLTPISVSRRLGDDSTPRPAEFLDASEDGSVVVFQSPDPLTDESRPAEGLLRSLYRYEPDTGELMDIAVTDPAVAPNGAGAEQVLVSADGEHVYFVTTEQLTSESVTGIGLYHWYDGALELLGTVPGPNVTQAYLRPAVSPSGGAIAWQNMDGVVYVHDAATGEIECVSCLGGTEAIGGPDLLGYAGSNPVDDDGRVFFNSPDRLVADDVNVAIDVYEWKDGTVRLVSSGKASSRATFAGATPDASSVFFTTDGRLVGQDVDNATDMYVARLGGGLISQFPVGLPAPCAGDGCQGALGDAPLALPAGTARLASTDNAEPTVAGCARLGKAARRARTRAKRLTRRAVRTSGPKARHLRRLSAAERKRGRKLSRRAARCARGAK